MVILDWLLILIGVALFGAFFVKGWLWLRK